MKTLNILKALFLLVTVSFFLSSCGSFKNQFSHQRYTDFKVKHADNYAKQEGSVNKTMNTATRNNESSEKQPKRSVLTASSETKKTSVEASEKNVRQSNLNAVKKNEEELSKRENKILEFKPVISPLNNKKESAGSELNIVLMILLCIFIPPLAIYLKDNAVSTLFWIVLLLCIFGGGFFYYAGFGVLWLIAMILAFIHVFK